MLLTDKNLSVKVSWTNFPVHDTVVCAEIFSAMWRFSHPFALYFFSKHICLVLLCSLPPGSTLVSPPPIFVSPFHSFPVFHPLVRKQQVLHSSPSAAEECRNIPDLGLSHSSSQDHLWGATVFISLFISYSVYSGFPQDFPSLGTLFLFLCVPLCTLVNVQQLWTHIFSQMKGTQPSCHVILLLLLCYGSPVLQVVVFSHHYITTRKADSSHF